jgi:general secretion pathway protein K
MRMSAKNMRRKQRGVALLVVLWGSTLAAIVLGALAINAHVEGLQARAQVDQAQTFYAAEAGLEQAVYNLHLKDDARRWISDGRSYRLDVGNILVQVSVMDDDGKINLNQADPALIGKLLVASGADPDRAATIVQAMKRWGEADQGVERPQFLAAGGFASIEELQRLPGMDQALYRRIESSLTLWQSGGSPNLSHASAPVVAAISNVSLGQASDFVRAREAMAAPVTRLPPLPGGITSLASPGTSGVVSITSQTKLADGVSTRLRATVRLTSEPGDRHTYRVLRWQVDAGT